MTTAEEREPQPAEVVREYGPFPGVLDAAGVTYDGTHIWLAAGTALHAVAPASGVVERTLSVPARAGTAFDGQHLYQLAGDRIQKIDRQSGAVVSTIPTPAPGDSSGLTWAEGCLWLGQYGGRKIHKIDPTTGAIVRTIESNRFVTGVTFVDGELWHGTQEKTGPGPAPSEIKSEIRRIDAATGEVLTRLTMPAGMIVSGLESDGGALLYAGGGKTGKIRAVRRVRDKR
jgi:hypothetical protein